jgi:hypothetical protein
MRWTLMWWTLISASLAGAPSTLGAPGAGAPASGEDRVELVLPWGSVGLSPALPEQAAFGPDLLALGPDGAWAVWDPVHAEVHGSFGRLSLPAATGLAFTAEGDLLVLHDGARELRRFRGLNEQARGRIDDLCPIGGELVVAGDEALVVDAFGNAHPAATLPSGGLGPARRPLLRPPAHRATLRQGRLALDGQPLNLGADVVAVRVLGDHLLVEHGARGAVTHRGLYPLRPIASPAAELRLPGPSAVYAPAAAIAVGPDGEVGWLDPQPDGLHIVRVRP